MSGFSYVRAWKQLEYILGGGLRYSISTNGWPGTLTKMCTSHASPLPAGEVMLSDVCYAVVDEADTMLQGGFDGVVFDILKPLVVCCGHARQ